MKRTNQNPVRSEKLRFRSSIVMLHVLLISTVMSFAGGCAKEEPADTTPPRGAEVQGIDKINPNQPVQPAEKLTPKFGKNRNKTAP
jgi:hypothetical protein